MNRDLTDDERAVLDLLLSWSGEWREVLTAQAASVRTSGLSCGCGCPSIALEVDRTAPRADSERVPADALARDANDNLVGVMLMVDDDGYMSELEFYSVAGPDIGFPRLDSLTPVEWSPRDADGTRHQLSPLPPPTMS